MFRPTNKFSHIRPLCTGLVLNERNPVFAEVVKVVNLIENVQTRVDTNGVNVLTQLSWFVALTIHEKVYHLGLKNINTSVATCKLWCFAICVILSPLAPQESHIWSKMKRLGAPELWTAQSGSESPKPWLLPSYSPVRIPLLGQTKEVARNLSCKGSTSPEVHTRLMWSRQKKYLDLRWYGHTKLVYIAYGSTYAEKSLVR